jgi:hypothetical protein
MNDGGYKAHTKSSVCICSFQQYSREWDILDMAC